MTLEEALWQDDERMSGAVCFRNTRVPVAFVFESLEKGQLSEFYEDFPSVKPEQVHAVVETSQRLVEGFFKVAA